MDHLKKEHNDLSKLIGSKIKESKGAEKCEVSKELKEKLNVLSCPVGREGKIK